MNRARAPKAAVVAAVVLALDGVFTLLTTVILFLPVFAFATELEPGSGRMRISVAILALTAVLTLICPATAVLVGGVCTRAAYLAGCVVAAVMTVAAAGLAAQLVGDDGRTPLAVTGAAVVANTVALILLLGCLRPGPPPAPAG